MGSGFVFDRDYGNLLIGEFFNNNVYYDVDGSGAYLLGLLTTFPVYALTDVVSFSDFKFGVRFKEDVGITLLIKDYVPNDNNPSYVLKADFIPNVGDVYVYRYSSNSSPLGLDTLGSTYGAYNFENSFSIFGDLDSSLSFSLDYFYNSFLRPDVVDKFLFPNYYGFGYYEGMLMRRIKSVSPNPYRPDLYVRVVYDYLYIFPLLPIHCCFPDFALIVRSLGGVPVTDQPQNLKIICQLLGVDTNTALKDCDAMKEYLNRIVTVLGGTFSTEPNENLKSICYLLGVDTAENGLSDCALSKDYIKRNGIMLGAENA